MTVEERLEIIDAKLAVLLRAVLSEPLYIKAISAKSPNREWDKAVRESKDILKQYNEILKIQNENINNTASKSPDLP